MLRPRNRERGFTLIELVMVIIIIGVLSAIIVPNFVDYVGKSGASTTKANLQILRTAIQTFRSENNGSWPANDLSNLVSPDFLPEIPAEGINDDANIVNTFDGLGGWHWDTTTHVLKPNIAGNDAFTDPFSGY